MTSRANQPCHCGSGRHYRNCHRPIDAARGKSEKYYAAQQVYARNWSLTSSSLAGEGIYDWLAALLQGVCPALILDIGCGSGRGIAALLHQFPDCRIISIEENVACIDEAERLLRSMGVQVRTVKRARTRATAFGVDREFRETNIPEGAQCVLIEGDICADPGLKTALKRLRFDAVTVWLTGTHMQRHADRVIAQSGVASSGDYRLFVQNQTYELAGDCLRPGGVLQAADRGEVPSNDLLREDSMRSHREQASVTELEVTSLDYIIYEEPENITTPLELTLGTSGRQADVSQIAVVAVASVQPLNRATSAP